MPNGSSARHEALAAAHSRQDPIRCAILTVSDTRTPATDEGGAMVARHVEGAGHLVVARRLVPDEPSAIEGAVRAWLADASIWAILITGGTGIGPRDRTIEVVRGLLSLELDGFGELFRMLSFEQVGAAAMLSRAAGGLVVQPASAGGDTLIFAMPGSVNAVETAMSRLVAPQLAHLVWERRRKTG